MKKSCKRHRSGQTILEYVVIVGVISLAMIAMSTYVFRSVQATQQVVQEGFDE